MYDILLYLIAASFTTMLLTAATLMVCMVVIYIKDEFF